MSYRRLWNHFRQASCKVMHYYDKYPLLMNSAVGGSVYFAGEFFVQYGNSPTGLSGVNYPRCMQLVGLGVVENGIFMSWWYRFLTKTVGNGVSTQIVLIKCAFDQIFFATQVDMIFLGTCALESFETFEDAVRDVKRTFLTTWIMDCAVWPLVNFFGFAFVPAKMLPTYMSTMQLFWQIYLSSISSSSGSDSNAVLSVEDSQKSKHEEEQLRKIFNDIDVDQNGKLDAYELLLALKMRGVKVSPTEIGQMIADADQQSEMKGDLKNCDGQVSFSEFVMINSQLNKKEGRKKIRHEQMWQTLKKPVKLEKGAKKAIHLIEDLKVKKGAEKVKKQIQASAVSHHQDTASRHHHGHPLRTMHDKLDHDPQYKLSKTEESRLRHPDKVGTIPTCTQVSGAHVTNASISVCDADTATKAGASTSPTPLAQSSVAAERQKETLKKSWRAWLKLGVASPTHAASAPTITEVAPEVAVEAAVEMVTQEIIPAIIPVVEDVAPKTLMDVMRAVWDNDRSYQDEEWDESRKEAMLQAKNGSALLLLLAVVRKFVFKV